MRDQGPNIKTLYNHIVKQPYLRELTVLVTRYNKQVERKGHGNRNRSIFCRH